MAVTQADIDAIDAALARGVLTVDIDDMKITYQTVNEMLKARAVLLAQLNRQVTGYATRSYASYGRE